MVTISVCMIVKNEEDILARCLDSLEGIWDELIIVDTGSSDNTKEIASKYTDKVYDFVWTGDFSEARNFALSKATCEYIYSADADEILDGINHELFLSLKSCLDPAIDVVQMYYGNQLEQGTVYNYDKELRPKLFKRVRPIQFIEPIHETLNIEPVIFDSEIVITHKPTSQHGGRDIETFKRLIAQGDMLSHRLRSFLFRELYMLGSMDDLMQLKEYLYLITEADDSTTDETLEACVLLAKYHRLCGEYIEMFNNVVKVVAMGSNSEICVELGQYYLECGDPINASIWFYNAYHECEPVLSIKAGKEYALEGLVRCYEELGDTENAAFYRTFIEE